MTERKRGVWKLASAEIVIGLVQVGIVGFMGSIFVEMCAGNIKSKKERNRKNA